MCYLEDLIAVSADCYIPWSVFEQSMLVLNETMVFEPRGV
jgi:hypothetical protein